MTLLDQCAALAAFLLLLILALRGRHSFLPIVVVMGVFIHHGHLGVARAIAISIAGVLAGDLWLFGLARDESDNGRLDKGSVGRLIPPSLRGRLHERLIRLGGRALITRHLPGGGGSAIVAMAGVRHMPEAEVLFWDALGLAIIVPCALAVGIGLDALAALVL